MPYGYQKIFWLAYDTTTENFQSPQGLAIEKI
jgi:hypothetical protein